MRFLEVALIFLAPTAGAGRWITEPEQYEQCFVSIHGETGRVLYGFEL